MSNKRRISVKIIGEDGNIFFIMGKVSRELKRNGQSAEAEEMCNRIYKCGSYDEALCIVMEYVDVE